METRIVKIDSADAAIEAAGEAARVLREGGLVAFPTETVYGLAAAAGTGAIERLRELKSRPANPFTVHVGRVEQALACAAAPPWQARCLMRKAWPGPLTLLLPAAADLDAELIMDGSVGLRLPDNAAARLMLAAVNLPVVAPSANLAGATPPQTAEEVLETFTGRIEMILDDGPTRSGTSSTIVKLDAEGNYKILRKGDLDAERLEKLMVRRVLIVCTGNTCRSPMAEGLLRKRLAEKLGCDLAELRGRGWDIISAGTGAYGQSPATDPAIRSAAQLGCDIAGHLSRPATEELINSCDLVFCLTEGHLMQVRQIAPRATGRVMPLDASGDVPDPIGGPQGLYDRTAKRIAQAIDKRLELVCGL